MDATSLAMPELTGFDAATQFVAALVYLGVGASAWIHAPDDIRTRVFLAFALSNVAAFTIPATAWLLGVRDPAVLPRAAIAATLAALAVGALLLFHFTQVFPRRRPWIRTAGIQMGIAYLLTPIVIAVLVRFWPASMDTVAPAYIAAFLVFGFPLMILLAFVLPVGAIVSLLRSHRDAQQAGAPIARPILLILTSQVAGGVLAVVFAPAISAAAPGTPLVSLVTLLIWALGLLTPLAFALAVFKYELPADAE